MEGEERFDKYHRLLSRDKWDIFRGSKILLKQLIKKDEKNMIIAIDEHKVVIAMQLNLAPETN